MPRNRTHTPEDLAQRALEVFWSNGYEATSMDDLVKATGVSRHGIYTDFGGKHSLFLACFKQYQDLIVSPAFERVEKPDASITEIAEYFEHQIALAEQGGMPGPGCFVGNTLTEVAPHDAKVLAMVKEHNDRLQLGLSNAIRNSLVRENELTDQEIFNMAEEVLVFATGLWAMSRITDNAANLRNVVSGFMTNLKERIKWKAPQ